MKLRPLLLAVGIAAVALPARAASVADGDFSAWSFGSTINPPSFATVTREAAGGNPDARLNVSTYSGPTILGTAIKTDYSSSDVLAGQPFTLMLDVLNGPGAHGDGQGLDLLVEQNGSLYANGLGVTGSTHINWDTLAFNGTFTAANFGALDGGAGHPDFSGATPTRFGFGAGNTISSYLTMYYDNFSLQSAALTAAIPEPGIVALLSAGLALLGFAARSGGRLSFPRPIVVPAKAGTQVLEEGNWTPAFAGETSSDLPEDFFRNSGVGARAASRRR